MRKLKIRAIAIAIATIALPSTLLADWRDDLGTFRVAIQTGQNVTEAVARAEPFRLALEEKLGMPVEFIPSRTHLGMVRFNNRAPAEYSVLSSIAYAAIANMCQCIDPLVTARTDDGSSGFQTVILSLPGGPRNLSGLAGRTLGVIGTDAVGGNTLALHEMAEQGLEEGDDGFTLRKFDDGEVAIEAFLNQEIDALMGWTVSGGSGSAGMLPGTARQLLTRVPEDPGHNVIWRSSEIPFRVHAVRANLPGEAKNALRDLLTGMFDNDPVAYDSIEPVYGGGFFAARPSQFEAISKMLDAAGITDQRPTDIITPIIERDSAEEEVSQEDAEEASQEEPTAGSTDTGQDDPANIEDDS